VRTPRTHEQVGTTRHVKAALSAMTMKNRKDVRG
jgi:hypothetical protein